VYLHDVIVFSPSAGGHVEHLRDFFAALRRANVFRKAKRCLKVEEKVQYLRHMVGRSQLKVLLAPQFCPGCQGLGLTAFSQRRRKLLNIQVFHIGCKQVGNEYKRRHASTSISLVSLMCPVITGYVPSLRAEWASPDTLCPT